ncbi:hypothetical protein PR048_007315 [Dryococelus australis]|uniref:Uncharacterized protein n=1 Tax=Dryococelus australis TaxID=614101 RepID=A0ABQ9IE83_9NEOP|nr:hypothetical protein PR048_007315 [Dryococelus australis]
MDETAIWIKNFTFGYPLLISSDGRGVSHGAYPYDEAVPPPMRNATMVGNTARNLPPGQLAARQETHLAAFRGCDQFLKKSGMGWHMSRGGCDSRPYGHEGECTSGSPAELREEEVDANGSDLAPRARSPWLTQRCFCIQQTPRPGGCAVATPDWWIETTLARARLSRPGHQISALMTATLCTLTLYSLVTAPSPGHRPAMAYIYDVTWSRRLSAPRVVEGGDDQKIRLLSQKSLTLPAGRTQDVLNVHVRNLTTGQTGDPRENPLTNDIFRHDTHVKKSGNEPAASRTRIVLLKIDTAEFSGRGGLVVRLLVSHLDEPGSTPGEVAPGFSDVRIEPDDVTARKKDVTDREMKVLYTVIYWACGAIERCHRPGNEVTVRRNIAGLWCNRKRACGAIERCHRPGNEVTVRRNIAGLWCNRKVTQTGNEVTVRRNIAGLWCNRKKGVTYREMKLLYAVIYWACGVIERCHRPGNEVTVRRNIAGLWCNRMTGNEVTVRRNIAGLWCNRKLSQTGNEVTVRRNIAGLWCNRKLSQTGNEVTVRRNIAGLWCNRKVSQNGNEVTVRRNIARLWCNRKKGVTYREMKVLYTVIYWACDAIERCHIPGNEGTVHRNILGLWCNRRLSQTGNEVSVRRNIAGLWCNRKKGVTYREMKVLYTVIYWACGAIERCHIPGNEVTVRRNIAGLWYNRKKGVTYREMKLLYAVIYWACGAIERGHRPGNEVTVRRNIAGLWCNRKVSQPGNEVTVRQRGHRPGNEVTVRRNIAGLWCNRKVSQPGNEVTVRRNIAGLWCNRKKGVTYREMKLLYAVIYRACGSIERCHIPGNEVTVHRNILGLWCNRKVSHTGKSKRCHRPGNEVTVHRNILACGAIERCHIPGNEVTVRRNIAGMWCNRKKGVTDREMKVLYTVIYWACGAIERCHRPGNEVTVHRNIAGLWFNRKRACGAIERCHRPGNEVTVRRNIAGLWCNRKVSQTGNEGTVHRNILGLWCNRKKGVTYREMKVLYTVIYWACGAIERCHIPGNEVIVRRNIAGLWFNRKKGVTYREMKVLYTVIYWACGAIERCHIPGNEVTVRRNIAGLWCNRKVSHTGKVKLLYTKDVTDREMKLLYTVIYWACGAIERCHIPGNEVTVRRNIAGLWCNRKNGVTYREMKVLYTVIYWACGAIERCHRPGNEGGRSPESSGGSYDGLWVRVVPSLADATGEEDHRLNSWKVLVCTSNRPIMAFRPDKRNDQTHSFVVVGWISTAEPAYKRRKAMRSSVLVDQLRREHMDNEVSGLLPSYSIGVKYATWLRKGSDKRKTIASTDPWGPTPPRGTAGWAFRITPNAGFSDGTWRSWISVSQTSRKSTGAMERMDSHGVTSESVSVFLPVPGHGWKEIVLAVVKSHPWADMSDSIKIIYNDMNYLSLEICLRTKKFTFFLAVNISLRDILFTLPILFMPAAGRCQDGITLATDRLAVLYTRASYDVLANSVCKVTWAPNPAHMYCATNVTQLLATEPSSQGRIHRTLKPILQIVSNVKLQDEFCMSVMWLMRRSHGSGNSLANLYNHPGRDLEAVNILSRDSPSSYYEKSSVRMRTYCMRVVQRAEQIKTRTRDGVSRQSPRNCIAVPSTSCFGHRKENEGRRELERVCDVFPGVSLDFFGQYVWAIFRRARLRSPPGSEKGKELVAEWQDARGENFSSQRGRNESKVMAAGERGRGAKAAPDRRDVVTSCVAAQKRRAPAKCAAWFGDSGDVTRGEGASPACRGGGHNCWRLRPVARATRSVYCTRKQPPRDWSLHSVTFNLRYCQRGEEGVQLRCKAGRNECYGSDRILNITFRVIPSDTILDCISLYHSPLATILGKDISPEENHPAPQKNAMTPLANQRLGASSPADREEFSSQSETGLVPRASRSQSGIVIKEGDFPAIFLLGQINLLHITDTRSTINCAIMAQKGFCAIKGEWSTKKLKRGENGAAPECKGGKREIPEKTRQPVASSSTIPTCENLGAIPPAIKLA